MYVNIISLNKEQAEISLSPVLQELQGLSDEGHLHVHRHSTLQRVLCWHQQNVCHLLHHEPHVWHVLQTHA